MIGCKCGGFTVSVQSKRSNTMLTWQECGSCGRAGDFVLKVDGEIVERGEKARRGYNNMLEANHA